MTDVLMPRLTDSMEEATILTWMKSVGDAVAVGEELVEIETDKANMAYESTDAGVLAEILVEEGETVEIGIPIARLGEVGAAAPSVADPRPAAEVASAAPTEPDPAPAPIAAAPADPAPTETAKGEVSYVDPTKLQGTIARRMAEAKATAPHFYLQATVDMSAAKAERQRRKAAAGEGEVVPSFNDVVVKSVALALREFPYANASYRDGRFELHSRINVGVAVASSDGLVVPTVFDADQKSLEEIATESRRLAAAVRDGSITPPELAGGTFTVSNLGMFGVRNFAAVINPPQAAILAVGAIEDRPAVRDGELAVATQMDVTLACDHRILHGAPGAEFLARVRELLEAGRLPS